MNTLVELSELRKRLVNLEDRVTELTALKNSVSDGTQQQFTLTSGNRNFNICKYDSRYYTYGMKEAFGMVKLGLIKGLDLEIDYIYSQMKVLKEKISKELNQLQDSLK